MQLDPFTVRDGLVECKADGVLPEVTRRHGRLLVRCWKCRRRQAVGTDSRLARIIRQTPEAYGLRRRITR